MEKNGKELIRIGERRRRERKDCEVREREKGEKKEKGAMTRLVSRGSEGDWGGGTCRGGGGRGRGRGRGGDGSSSSIATRVSKVGTTIHSHCGDGGAAPPARRSHSGFSTLAPSALIPRSIVVTLTSTRPCRALR
jgi:hypothetical protein